MKNIISLVLILLLLFSLAVAMVSCGDEPEEPINIEKNPTQNPESEVPEWNDPSLNGGGVVFPPVQLPSSD